MAKIICAIQFWEGDITEALKLTQLIADIEPRFNDFAEILLFSRHDMGEPKENRIIQEMDRMLSLKFKTFTRRCSRRGTGHPEGANDMWHDLIQQVFIMHRDKETAAECFLSFEADCVPVTADWILRLYNEWKANGRLITGALCNAGTPDEHINGNLVANVELAARMPQLMGSPHNVPWDMYHRLAIVAESAPSKIIWNDYRRPTITAQEMFCERNGVIPAMIHGVRDDSGRRLARKKLVL
jgi:hypothetical protein